MDKPNPYPDPTWRPDAVRPLTVGLEHLFAWQLDLENARRRLEGRTVLSPTVAWEQVKRKAELDRR